MDSSQSIPRLIQLVTTINLSVAKIQQVLDSQQAPTPSFDEDSPPLPVDIREAQDVVLDATAELHDLLTDPLNLVHRSARGDKTACLQTIARFDIASLVPPGGQVSFKELASQTPLTEQMMGRIIRHAVTMRVFREPECGFVAHTRASRMLASPEMRDWIRAGTEELGPAGGKRAVRFANAMKVMTSKPEFDACYGTDFYDWASLGTAQVVDVGGGNGHFALTLAKRYPRLDIVVQDMAKVVENATSGDLRERVRFMAHNLFDAQTIPADVFFFRWIFHNWSDRYCMQILKAQLPALKKGARLVVQESFMPASGSVPQCKERDLRAMDLEMAYTFNSRERTLADWKALFREADPGFVFKSAIEPKGSAMGILEFEWDGADGSAT
ncbi:sterigmatocystin 8-O-methyltransferase, partial [Metarhizium majus ARSEF 297]